MKPEFNKWYIVLNSKKHTNDWLKLYPEFAIFWKNKNKWMAYTENKYKKIATFWYDEIDFELEYGERLATKKEINKYNLDVNKARHETIANLLDPKRWSDDD